MDNQVNFQARWTQKGVATVRVTATWIAGPAVSIAVQTALRLAHLLQLLPVLIDGDAVWGDQLSTAFSTRGGTCVFASRR
jgi:hypothetical protein